MPRVEEVVNEDNELEAAINFVGLVLRSTFLK